EREREREIRETGTAEGSKRRAAGTCLLCLRVAAGRSNSSQRKTQRKRQQRYRRDREKRQREPGREEEGLTCRDPVYARRQRWQHPSWPPLRLQLSLLLPLTES
ncbi:hypothetical protein H103_07639, partial [Trichophyton rubrum CBS 288.86]